MSKDYIRGRRINNRPLYDSETLEDILKVTSKNEYFGKEIIDWQDVRPREGGPYSLFCYNCQRWIPNTANNEMKKEGFHAHSHRCVKYEDNTVEVFYEWGKPFDESIAREE